MSISFGQGLAAFAGGAIDRAKEIDKEVAERVKTLKASKPDELLKTRYKKEYEKFDKEQATLEQVESVGANTEKGQMLLLGIESQDEYRKMLSSDNTLYAKMRTAPTAPKYTPTDYNLSGPNTAQRLWASMTGDDKTADAGAIESTAGSTTTFRRGQGIEQTPEGKVRMDKWRGQLPSGEDEKEWQFKWKQHTKLITEATDKFKDSMGSDEAKRVFSQLNSDGRTLIYGKEGKSSETDWQRKLNLHMLDTPKRTNFEDDTSFNKAMTTWKHGYNILKLGSGYDKSKDKEGKMQFIEILNPGTKDKHKVGYTGEPNDNAFGNLVGWRDFGMVESGSSTTAPTIKEIFFDGKQQKIEYTGAPTDVVGNSVGWKLIGSTKSDTTGSASGPKIGDTQEVYVSGNSGAKQKLYYTGDNTDRYNGRFVGWTTIGGTSALPEGSFTKERWDLIQAPIYAAIKSGNKVDPKDWEAFRLYTLSNKDAIGIEYQSVLNSLEKLAEDGLSYPSITIKVDGNKVPATLANMVLKAKESNISLKAFRKQLHQHYLSKQTQK